MKVQGYNGAWVNGQTLKVYSIPTFKFGRSPTRMNFSENGRLALEDPQNEILFSAANIWEIAFKKRSGRKNFAFASDQIAKAAKESGFAELPVFAIAAALVEQLPLTPL